MDKWIVLAVGYAGLAVVTFVPVAWALARVAELKDGGPAFAESPHFQDEAQLLLEQHDARIRGTLMFWKTQAERYRRFHYYVVSWTIPSAIIIPILAQANNGTPPAKLLLTLVSAFTAILLAFHRALQVEANFRAFRNGESDFYDLRRRLLDRPQSFGATQGEQVATYFSEAEAIRRFVRNAETNNFPTLEEVRRSVNGDHGHRSHTAPVGGPHAEAEIAKN